MAETREWEESVKLGNPCGRVRAHKELDGAVWYDGDVLTPWGIVSVYSDDAYTRYDIAMNHRLYSRYERRSRKPRGIAVKAGKFAASIAWKFAPSGGSPR